MLTATVFFHLFFLSLVFFRGYGDLVPDGIFPFVLFFTGLYFYFTGGQESENCVLEFEADKHKTSFSL